MMGFGNFIRGKVFEILFLIFSVLSVFYVSDRTGRLLFAFFGNDYSLIILCILVLIMGYMYIYTKSSKEIKQTRNLHEVCSLIMCILLYLTMCLWIYDIMDLLIDIEDSRAYLIPVIASLIITLYGFIHAKNLYIKEYNIDLPYKTKKTKIVLLSDIHTGTYVNFKQLQKIVSKVNELEPEMIIIAGDMFDVEAFAYCDKNKTAEILSKLRAKSGKYAVLGNHDPSSASKEIKDFYKAANIRLLIDEKVETDEFIIVGRDDITTNHERKSLNKIIGKNDLKKIIIAVDHNPLGINEAVKNDVDLILCGHTHKGQFFPANIFTKLSYGRDGYYGFHKKGKTKIIVSSGAGFFQMPMRIGSNSEIVVINN